MYQNTGRTYDTAQSRFIDFCFNTGQLAPAGLPCPASEWTMMLFATHLAQSLHPCKSYKSLFIRGSFPTHRVRYRQHVGRRVRPKPTFKLGRRVHRSALEPYVHVDANKKVQNRLFTQMVYLANRLDWFRRPCSDSVSLQTR